MSSNYANNREAGFYKPEQHPDKLFEPKEAKPDCICPNVFNLHITGCPLGEATVDQPQGTDSNESAHESLQVAKDVTNTTPHSTDKLVGALLSNMKLSPQAYHQMWGFVTDDINHLIAQAVRAELDYLERHGHGGGNWRRLIIERKARIQALEGEG